MIFSRKKELNKKSIFLDSPKEQNPSHSSSSQLNPLIKEITGHTKYYIHEHYIIKPKTKKYRVRGQAPDNKKTYFSLLIPHSPKNHFPHLLACKGGKLFFSPHFCEYEFPSFLQNTKIQNTKYKRLTPALPRAKNQKNQGQDLETRKPRFEMRPSAERQSRIEERQRHA
jgi:hypothetical protein